MHDKSILAIALAMACVACEMSEHQPTIETVDKADRHGRNASDAGGAGGNMLERDQKTPTSWDQGENDADLTVTQNIRRALVKDSSLSISAKNITVITKNGVVTLRGSVNSNNELDTVLKIVNSSKGNARLENLLEVINP